MPNQNRHIYNKSEKIIAASIFLLGFTSLISAALFESYILSFIGIALVFWGALLFYISFEHVPLELLVTISLSSVENIERILKNRKIAAKGIYLAPKYLRDYSKSLVLIPLGKDQKIPESKLFDESDLFSEQPAGILLRPLGFALLQKLELSLGSSFDKLSLDELLCRLPNLLVTQLTLIDRLEFIKEKNKISITLVNSILSSLDSMMNNLPTTRETIGCHLTSAIACAIAKSAGKSVIIEKESNQNKKQKLYSKSWIHENSYFTY